MRAVLVLGLLLVLASGAFAVIAVAENFSGGPEYAVEIFGNRIATLGAPGLFLSGVALALIFCLGLALLAAGRKRHRRERVLLGSAPAARTTAQEAGEAEGRRPRSGHRRRRHLFGH